MAPVRRRVPGLPSRDARGESPALAQGVALAQDVALAPPVALAQGVALTFGACTWCPWNRIAATWVIVSVPAR